MTPLAPHRARALGGRVLRQLRADPRFVAVSLIIPLVITFLLKMFFDAIDIPMFDQTRFAVPGAAFIVHFVTYILTALVLVRERVGGTMERMFINGYRQLEIIGGYLAAYTVLATWQSLLILTWVAFLFDLGYSIGSYVQIYLVIWLLAVLSMALGILVSNFARTEGQVIPFIPLIIVPSVFLSGMIVAVEDLPTWAQVLARFTPLFYANEVLQGVISGGTVLDTLGPFVALPLLTAGVLVLASRTLREGS
ncbi:MAG: ABC transporter permease [Acidimicrobiia bacterium]|jgi:ABC-2 type transport system permease protein